MNLLYLALLLFGILYHNVKPETYDMEFFSVSDKTIRSPKTIEDELKTNEERENAADEVENVYVFKKEIAQNRISLLLPFSTLLKKQIRNFWQMNSRRKNLKTREVKKVTTCRLLIKAEIIKNKLTANVTEDITNSISDQILVSLLQAEPEDFKIIRMLISSR